MYNKILNVIVIQISIIMTNQVAVYARDHGSGPLLSDSLGLLHRLSPEVRLEILGYSLEDVDICVPIDYNRPYLVKTLPQIPALFLVSKLVSTEASDVLYSKKVFRVTIFQDKLNARVNWDWRGRAERRFRGAHLAPFKPSLERIKHLEIKVVFNLNHYEGDIRIIDYDDGPGYGLLSRDLKQSAASPPSLSSQQSTNLTINFDQLLGLLTAFGDPEIHRRSCRIIWETPERRCLLQEGSYESFERLRDSGFEEGQDPTPNIDLLAHPLVRAFAEFVSFTKLTLEYHTLSTDPNWRGCSFNSKRATSMQQAIRTTWGMELGEAKSQVQEDGERGYLRMMSGDGETPVELEAWVALFAENTKRRQQEKERQERERVEADKRRKEEESRGHVSIFGDGIYGKQPTPSPPPSPPVSPGPGRRPDVEVWTWKEWALEFSPRKAHEAKRLGEEHTNWLVEKETRGTKLLGEVKKILDERLRRASHRFEAKREVAITGGAAEPDTSDEELGDDFWGDPTYDEDTEEEESEEDKGDDTDDSPEDAIDE